MKHDFISVQAKVLEMYTVLESNQLPQEVKKIEQNDLHPVAVLV